MFEDGVCWSLVDIRLPLAEGPEGKKRRDKLFTKLDPNGNGSLSLTEVQAGLSGLLESGSGKRKTNEAAQGLIPGITDFRPAVKAAFCHARNLGHSEVADSSTVDRTEFHALLFFFRHYLELLVLFKNLDHSGELSLSEEDIMSEISRLEKWGITEAQVEQKLKSEPGHHISFNHFAEWCLRSTLEGLVFDMQEGQEMLSKPSSPSAAPANAGKGKVDWAAVDERLPTASTPEASAERDELFKKMDITSTRALCLTSVQASMSFLLEGDHAQRKKGEVSQTLIPGIRDTRPAVKSAFQAARSLAPLPDRKGKKQQWQREDDTVDRREFHAMLVYLRYYLELQVLFQDLDTSEDNRISKEECDLALPLLAGWGIDKTLVQKRFAEAKGELKFANFADWCLRIRLEGHPFDVLETDAPEAEVEAVATEGNNKESIPDNQAVQSPPPLPTEAKEKEMILEDEAEQVLKQVLEEVVPSSPPTSPPNKEAILEDQEPRIKSAPQVLSFEDEERNSPKEAAQSLPNTSKDCLNNWDLPGRPERATDRNWSMPRKPLSKSYGSLPFQSTGVLKRPPHMKTLSTIRSLPKWRFGEKRESGFLRTNDNPAPGTYGFPKFEKTNKFRDQAVYGFGGGPSRFDDGDHPEKIQPAPGQYGIPVNPVHEILRRPAMCNAPRGSGHQVIRADGPGPGAYDKRSTLGGQLVTATGKFHATYRPRHGLPGPGAYMPKFGCLTHERTAPKVSIGHSTRETLNDRHHEVKPGPGNYEHDTFQSFGKSSRSTTGFSFRSRTTCPRNYTTYTDPGPGTYDGDGTCFGY